MVGKYSSDYQNHYLKITRVRDNINELEYLLQECEKAELLKQESYQRNNEILNHRLVVVNRSLEKEIGYNNQVTKELRLLEERIQILLSEVYTLKDELSRNQKTILRLKNYKNKKRAQFKRWLKMRLKK